MLKKILYEPLVHFIFLAFMFFVVYDYLNPEEPDSNTITVTEGRIALLKNNFTDRWGREPFANEVDNAIHNFTLNEIYTREARALGMDRNDPVIDQRLRRKINFMLEDLASAKQPTDDELKTYYESHIDKYLVPALYSFKQVFIATDKTAEELNRALLTIRQQLKQGFEPAGEPIMLPNEISQATALEVEKRFGPLFSEQLDAFALNEWQGPIDSAFGKHFVFLSQKQESVVMPFEKVKEDVLNHWRYDHNNVFKQSFEQKLLEKYNVVIEKSASDNKSS